MRAGASLDMPMGSVMQDPVLDTSSLRGSARVPGQREYRESVPEVSRLAKPSGEHEEEHAVSRFTSGLRASGERIKGVVEKSGNSSSHGRNAGLFDVNREPCRARSRPPGIRDRQSGL